MASIDRDIISVTPTIYGDELNVRSKFGLPFLMRENTTLNERFEIEAGTMPAPNLFPTLKYLVLGNLGHTTVKAADGSDETEAMIHTASDAAPYGPIPFVLREASNDLPAERRGRYALRRQEVHEGRTYIAYYARRLDTTNITVGLQRITKEDGIVTSEPFVPTPEHLNPERPEISNTGTVLGSKSSLIASAVMTVQLDTDDIIEIMNAHRIRTGSVRSPVISELALCTGVDREVSTSVGGSGSFMYTEVIGCQVNVFISTYRSIGHSADGARFSFDIGSVEPLLGADDIAGASFLTP